MVNKPAKKPKKIKRRVTKPGGYQPHEHRPTMHSRAKVIEFVCAGFKQDSIAMYFDIDGDTLRKHYREELDKSNMMRTGKLAKNLYLDALAGDKSAREFWLKTQGRWSYAKPPEDEKPSKVESLLERIADKL